MRVYSLNRGSFVVVRMADVRNGYNSLAYDQVRDELLSVDPGGYLILAYLMSHPDSSSGEISRAINGSSLKMDGKDLQGFLDELIGKNVVYEQTK